jgi:hypothetical protein
LVTYGVATNFVREEFVETLHGEIKWHTGNIFGPKGEIGTMPLDRLVHAYSLKGIS